MSDRPLVSGEFLAKLFNVTVRRVQQLAKDDIVVKAGRGKYDLIASVQGYVKYLQDLSIGKTPSPEQLHIQRTRLLSAQAEKTELEVKVMHSQLVPIDEVNDFLLPMLNNFRSRCLSVPHAIAHQLVTITKVSEIEEIVRGKIYEALTELSEYEPDNQSSKRNHKERKPDSKAPAIAKSQ